MNIAKIMIPKISTVFLYEKDTIRQGLERFMVHGYTAVPVLNDQEQYIGSVTEGDFLRHLLACQTTDLKVQEGYGPSGTAIIVKCLTDNKNRTAANVRNAFTKGQGSIGTQGCVSYMFDEKGQIIIDKEECDMDGDDLMMLALDAGAEDFSDADDSFEITTAPEDFDAVHKALEEQNIPMASAEVTMIPQTYVTLTDEADITNIGRILDFLDDDDDVQEVYHNWEE